MNIRAIIALTFAFVTSAASAETVEELKKELAAKDAYINKLEQRLRAREKKSNPPQAGLIKPAPVVAVVPPPPPPPEAVDDELDRALERTLVREGALVLAPYTYELTPQISAAHWDKVQDPLLRNSYAAAMTFRMGLPWQSQIAASAPFVYNQLADGSSSSGLGDAGFLFSKELLAGSDSTPGVTASVGWTSPVNHGGTFGPIPYVSGFQGGLTAVQRFDPLVAFATLSYFSAAAREIAGTRVTSSDVAALRVGSSLAVSPETSVTVGINFAYLTNPHAIDFVVPNADRLLSTVDVSFTTVVASRTLLNLMAQFGLVGHVPDVRLIASLPVRF